MKALRMTLPLGALTTDECAAAIAAGSMASPRFC